MNVLNGSENPCLRFTIPSPASFAGTNELPLSRRAQWKNVRPGLLSRRTIRYQIRAPVNTDRAFHRDQLGERARWRSTGMVTGLRLFFRPDEHLVRQQLLK